MRIKIQRLLLGQDRLPGQILSGRFVQVLQPGLVCRKKYERVLIEPGRIAAGHKNGLGGGFGRASRLLAVGVIDPQHDQPGVQVIRHVLSRVRHGVDAAEVAGLAEVLPEALVQLIHDLVEIALQLLGAVIGQLGDGGLGGIPVTWSILVKISGGPGQPAQRITEDGRRLAGHHAA